MKSLPWVIRVAAQPRHGGGHLARSSVLANALAAYGPVVFVLDAGAEAAAKRVGDLGFGVCFEGEPPEGPFAGSICDGYEFDSETYAELATHGPVVVMDDFLTPLPEADLVVNAACHLEGNDIGGVPALLGPSYAIVDERFVQSTAIHEDVRRVVVTFGLLDPENVTGITVAALESLWAEGFQFSVDVVMSGASPHLETMSSAIAGFAGQARLVLDAPDMADVLSGADLVIGAGGVSLFERAAMGIPSVTVSIVENQDLFVAGAARAGVTIDAGPAAALSGDALARAIRDLAVDAGRRAAMSRHCKSIIDGQGANRIAAALQSLVAGVQEKAV